MQQYQVAGTANNSSRYKSQDLLSDNVDNGPTVKMDVAQERKTISHWVRDDLEDKYLRLLEDHQTLKKHARLQEMKIKTMSTKMLKLTSDIKKSGDVTPKSEDQEEMMRKCSILESQNVLMKDKLKLLQSQLLAQGKKPMDNVQPRYLDDKKPNGAMTSSRKANIRVIKPKGVMYPLSPRRDDSRDINDNTVIQQRLVEDLKYQLKKQQMDNEDLIMKLRSFKETSDNRGDALRPHLKDNFDMIRLGRDVKDKEIQINVIQSKYEDLKLRQMHLERSNHEMADEIDRLNAQNRHGDESGLGGAAADGQMRNTSVLRKRIADLETINGDVRKEVALLKQANVQLTEDAFNTERERDWREKEMNLRAKIAQLEATQRRDVGEKGGVLTKLEQERDRTDSAEHELSGLRLRNYELQARIDELSDKLRLFSKDATVDPREIQEALIIIEHKRNLQHAKSTPELDFIEKVDARKQQDASRQLHEAELQHADTIGELEKTRSLLRTQYKISNDYRVESERVAARLDDVKADYESRLGEYARLLDIRAARIRKLEAQLKDIAYGTRDTRIVLDGVDIADQATAASVAMGAPGALSQELLARGENVLEVHIGRVSLTQHAVDSLSDREPFLFGTWDFFDFETQATGVLRGTSSDFDIKAEYVVKVDDFFLNYLAKSTFTFELHQATGAEYVTLAACQLSCRDMFAVSRDNKPLPSGGRSSGTRYTGRAKLVGLHGNAVDTNFGVLEYWVRLRQPMEQVIRQYREKLKAEGYIAGNEIALAEASKPADNMNELVIRIIRCQGLRSRQKHLQPSAYIAYTFYDQRAHTTVTIASSNSPEFHDTKRFPVHMNADLHQFLKSQQLHMYVFDELDPDETAYLGVAVVPLIPLGHNHSISGIFELQDPQHVANGTVEIDVAWRQNYLFSDDLLHYQTEHVALLPGEENVRHDSQPSRQARQEPKSPDKKAAGDSTDHGAVVVTETVSVSKEVPKKKERQKKTGEHHDQPVVPASESGLVSPPSVQLVKGILKTPTKQPRRDRALSDSLKDKKILDNLMMFDVEMKERSPEDSSVLINEDEIKSMDVSMKEHDVKQNLEMVSKKLEKSLKTRDVSPPKSQVPKSASDSASVSITEQVVSVKKKKPSKKEKFQNEEFDDDESKVEKEKIDKVKQDEPEKDKTKKDGSKKDKVKKEDSKKDKSKKDEEAKIDKSEKDDESEKDKSKKHEPKKDKSNKDKSKSEDSKKDKDKKHKEDKVPSSMSVENDDVVIDKKPRKSVVRPDSNADEIVVEIASVELADSADILKDSSVQNLFVEYRLPGISTELTETVSLKKPSLKDHDKKMKYNFRKTFDVSYNKNYMIRQHIATMLTEESNKNIVFTLVQEPNEDTDSECEDIAVARLDVQTLLKEDRNLNNEILPMYSLKTKGELIGHMCVTVRILGVLKAIEKELKKS